MSKYVVESERPLVTAERLTSELQVVTPGLSASEPMPLDFNQKWSDTVESFKGALVSRVEAEALRTPNGTDSIASFIHKHLNILKHPWFDTTACGVGLPVLFGGGIVFALNTGVLQVLGITACVLGLVTVFGSAINSNLVPFYLNAMNKRVLESKTLAGQAVFEVADQMYQAQVSQWAEQRYGVKMKNRWDSQVKRLAEDLVYVGDKNGRRVYCREANVGWVLTFDGGEELPVLVDVQELVKA